MTVSLSPHRTDLPVGRPTGDTYMHNLLGTEEDLGENEAGQGDRMVRHGTIGETGQKRTL